MSDKQPNGSTQFTKGVSGNPAGRPKGSRNKATLLMEAMLEGGVEAITRKLIEMAKGGNLGAIRLCLEPLLPLRKDRTIHLDLPPAETVQQISALIGKISAAIAEGEITPAEGESLTKVLKTQTEVILAADFERRLQEVEALVKRGPVQRDEKEAA